MREISTMQRGIDRAAARQRWVDWRWHSTLVLVAMCIFAMLTGAAYARSAPDSFADLAEELSPAVVNISTTQRVASGQGRMEFQFPPGSPFEEFFKEFFDRNQQGDRNRPTRRVTSLGSGFVIDPAGLVVTNNHVIAEADEITVNFADGRKYEATVVGKDPKTDLALLRIEPDQDLVSVPWGDSGESRVGDWVVAIGNPFGLGGSVTAGIISAISRDINAGPYDDFIQTDASINRGNSGGPLFNMDGEVIGINTAIFSPSGGSVGIGFAVPSAIARNVILQLERFGKTRRGWLGVRIQTVTDEIAEGLGLDRPRGALVAGLTEGGPAEQFGLQQRDVILKFDNRPIEEMRELPRIVADTEIGKPVPVEIWRDGQFQTLQVEIGELDESEAQVAAVDPTSPESTEELQALGMTLTGMNEEVRDRFEIGEQALGVVVTDVTIESPAAEKGIRPGDIIVEVADEEVTSPDQVVSKITQLRQAKRKIVLFLLERGGDRRYVPVRLDES